MFEQFHAASLQDMQHQAIIHKAPDGDYWAEVPSLPGCATQGATLKELRRNLREAIGGCLDALDHTTVLQARVNNADKRLYSSITVRSRLGLIKKK